MNDRTELKRLAEAANAVTGDVSVDIAITSERGPNQSEIDAVTAFVGAATPTAVLALIAENERLTKAVGLQVIRRFVGDDDQKNIDELVAAGIQVDKELIVQLKAENERLAAACERAEQIIIVECKAASLAKVRANLLEANRDQLRAEVAGLKTGYEAYERVNAELKAENESLRRERDARHPFKPFHEPAIGFTGCVICGVYTDHGGLPCPKTRASADAALGKGEQS